MRRSTWSSPRRTCPEARARTTSSPSATSTRRWGGSSRRVPKDGATLVVLYSDHESIVHGGGDEASVPMILGRLSGDASLAPLSRQGRPVQALEGVYEVSSLHRYLKDCLDATAH